MKLSLKFNIFKLVNAKMNELGVSLWDVVRYGKAVEMAHYREMEKSDESKAEIHKVTQMTNSTYV